MVWSRIMQLSKGKRKLVVLSMLFLFPLIFIVAPLAILYLYVNTENNYLVYALICLNITIAVLFILLPGIIVRIRSVMAKGSIDDTTAGGNHKKDLIVMLMLVALAAFLLIPTTYLMVGSLSKSNRYVSMCSTLNPVLDEYYTFAAEFGDYGKYTIAATEYDLDVQRLEAKAVIVELHNYETDEDSGVSLMNVRLLSEGYPIAISPDEVRTIIILLYDDIEVGEYSGGGGWAYKQVCRISVIDRDRNIIVRETTIYGGEPPETIINYESGTGSAPEYDEILSYIQSLESDFK